ncbi:phage envelope protein [Chryseobacterium sp. T16E-39]|nr:phage envelope protein [Chryseobacterium sp. T16E-39]
MKFTIDEIKAEHQKVKSGADFPRYIQAIKEKGVSHYTTYVSDGNTQYFDNENQSAETGGKYNTLSISETLNLDHFKTRLKLHQKGGTDYPTFCQDCAESGIEGWEMDLNEMTCTYFDYKKNHILVEQIPSQ